MNATYTQTFLVGPHYFEIATADAWGKELTEILLPTLHPFRIATDSKKEICFTLTIDTPQKNTCYSPDKVIENFEWEGAAYTIYQDEDRETYSIGILLHDGVQRLLTLDRNMRHAHTELHSIHPSEAFVLKNFLMMLYAFATAPLGTLLMHASVIMNQEQGFLFLGKSGTGKSTHTRLWLEHIPGSELLNDDNPVVHASEDGKVTVYGSPWSGKTPCYKQASAPVGAFVQLVQAPENHIRKEGYARAFATLLPSCSCLKKDSTIHNGILDTITRIASCIPVYRLECLPDEEAARISYQTIIAKS